MSEDGMTFEESRSETVNPVVGDHPSAERLRWYVTRELGEFGERHAIAAHLARCAACFRIAGELERLATDWLDSEWLLEEAVACEEPERSIDGEDANETVEGASVYAVTKASDEGRPAERRDTWVTNRHIFQGLAAALCLAVGSGGLWWSWRPAQSIKRVPATEAGEATVVRKPSEPASVGDLAQSGSTKNVKGTLAGAIVNALESEDRNYLVLVSDVPGLHGTNVRKADTVEAVARRDGAGREPATVTSGSVSVAAAVAGTTPFPPDLAGVPTSRKRRLTVDPFDYSAVTNWVQYWFKDNVNIGEGFRDMLAARMAQSEDITLLDRKRVNESALNRDFGPSSRVTGGTNAAIDQSAGLDAMLFGDIVVFGRDDTSRDRVVGGAVLRRSAGVAIAELRRNEKVVVGINLRVVDPQTGEVLETAEARGESSRRSTEGGRELGPVLRDQHYMTSSSFEQTLIGEATRNAIDTAVNFLERRVAQLPMKPRRIEGRVAALSPAAALLNVGSVDGVLRGDRFEILRIEGEVKDPITSQMRYADAMKVGELVVDRVRDKVASGAYGGQPLSSVYLVASGKGYVARLITKD
jgi:curli biogenesis system outer membrane secretion channel CsgG